jgi:hypothetical protein
VRPGLGASLGEHFFALISLSVCLSPMQQKVRNQKLSPCHDFLPLGHHFAVKLAQSAQRMHTSAEPVVARVGKEKEEKKRSDRSFQKGRANEGNEMMMHAASFGKSATKKKNDAPRLPASGASRRCETRPRHSKVRNVCIPRPSRSLLEWGKRRKRKNVRSVISKRANAVEM